MKRVRRKRRDPRPAPRRRTPPVARDPALVILCLDISSVCIGWAVFHGEQLRFHGKYATQGTGHGERLMYFSEWLLERLCEYEPSDVIVEEPYPGRFRNAYAVLMQYISVVLAVHFRWSGMELPGENRVPAARVKQVLEMPKGADHEARKRAMVLEINRLYGLSLKFKADDAKKRTSDDDTADAIALGRCWLLLEEKRDNE